MNSIERVKCVLAGQMPDRPPVSFWHHFRPDQYFGRPAVEAHLDHLRAFDLDFLKVMNDNGYPFRGHLETVGDLAALVECRGDEPEFARQLDLLSDLRARLHGRVLMTSTIFNSWAVLRSLIRPPKGHNPPNMDGEADEPSARIRAWSAQDPGAVRGALERIANGLANFGAHRLAAGADGIYLSVRDDWVRIRAARAGHDLYDDMVRPGDLAVLHAAATGSFNILHVCGRAVDFRSFASYPVQAINWADRAAGPPIAQVRHWLRPALCAGVDNLSTLPDGTPQEVAEQVADAIHQAGDRPIIIAPGCTYDPARVARANLQAMGKAARAAHPTARTTVSA